MSEEKKKLSPGELVVKFGELCQVPAELRTMVVGTLRGKAKDIQEWNPNKDDNGTVIIFNDTKGIGDALAYTLFRKYYTQIFTDNPDLEPERMAPSENNIAFPFTRYSDLFYLMEQLKEGKADYTLREVVDMHVMKRICMVITGYYQLTGDDYATAIIDDIIERRIELRNVMTTVLTTRLTAQEFKARNEFLYHALSAGKKWEIK